jgi:Flp pilus assembly pilin Flp
VRARLLKLWREDEGQGLTEYALLLFLVCMIAVAAVRGFASSMTNMYSQASHQVIAAAAKGAGAGSSLVYSHSSSITSQQKRFDDDVLSNRIVVRSTKP